jgi:radical SAM protein with 4Fe4S-binding SPASM domain
MTTIPATCENLFEDIKFAEKKGFKNFFVIPNVFEEWNGRAKEILTNEFKKYTDYYIDCYRAGEKPIEFSTLEKSFSDIVKINKAITQKTYRQSIDCKACGKCGLGSSSYASIHPNGNLYGCQEMTSNEGEESLFYIGNLYSGVDDNKRQTLIELFDSADVSGPNCDTCKYNRICDGGCVANNYLQNGSLHKSPDMFCWWKQVILNEAIRIAQTLGKEENELFKQRWCNR